MWSSSSVNLGHLGNLFLHKSALVGEGWRMDPWLEAVMALVVSWLRTSKPRLGCVVTSRDKSPWSCHPCREWRLHHRLWFSKCRPHSLPQRVILSRFQYLFPKRFWYASTLLLHETCPNIAPAATSKFTVLVEILNSYEQLVLGSLKVALSMHSPQNSLISKTHETDLLSCQLDECQLPSPPPTPTKCNQNVGSFLPPRTTTAAAASLLQEESLQ